MSKDWWDTWVMDNWLEPALGLLMLVGVNSLVLALIYDYPTGLFWWDFGIIAAGILCAFVVLFLVLGLLRKRRISETSTMRISTRMGGLALGVLGSDLVLVSLENPSLGVLAVAFVCLAAASAIAWWFVRKS